ncbi:uncharacterized protein BYT42DRAFT_82290 [Radiomyces spectabilis]|uniref:uncharacterized protein n=1 Tax=Radiomyces spectabilis TaxID=64574 RepID=UPI002220661C|nr:uncharacterized protein BYT42DRAFT_82290 [Radiomyces spectabilis]KAI8371797.1 hypothetical protein BYT42DRAFT_82290 [Radiomyces spectabilis]
MKQIPCYLSMKDAIVLSLNQKARNSLSWLSSPMVISVLIVSARHEPLNDQEKVKCCDCLSGILDTTREVQRSLFTESRWPMLVERFKSRRLRHIPKLHAELRKVSNTGSAEAESDDILKDAIQEVESSKRLKRHDVQWVSFKTFRQELRTPSST